MNEMEKIHVQIAALLDARNFLLGQQPSDLVALAQIAEMISDLNARQLSLLKLPSIPLISPEAERALRGRVRRLDRDMQASAAADRIVAGAAALIRV